MSCPDCFRGAVHTHATPTGTIETLHGIKTYVADGSGSSDTSTSTIIYFPDAFSMKLPNNKILADQYAAATGCRVLFPDVVLNGGLPVHVLEGFEYITGTPTTATSALAKAYTIVTLLPHIVPFMLWGHPRHNYAAMLKYARDVRASLPEGAKLGVCGFCWGAWPSTKLCGEAASVDQDETRRLVDAQFNGHPSYIIKEPTLVADCIRRFKTPYASAVAEKDFQFNAAVAAQTEAQLRDSVHSKGDGENGYVFEFRVYKGATHGFCVKAREEDMQSYHDAVAHAVTWFKTYLN
jgi:dienelactone hydrolase